MWSESLAIPQLQPTPPSKSHGSFVWRSKVSKSSLFREGCSTFSHFSWSEWTPLLLEPDLISTSLQIPDEDPLLWIGRIDDGYFTFANDRHLCHILNIDDPGVEYFRYSPYLEEWLDFHPDEPISAASNGPILLRSAQHMRATAWDELEEYIRLAHKNHYAARKIPTPPLTTDRQEDDIMED